MERIKEQHPDWTEEQIDQAYQEQKYGYSDIIGKSGLEYAMEDQLRGERGEKRITTDASGNVLTTEIIKQAKPATPSSPPWTRICSGQRWKGARSF